MRIGIIDLGTNSIRFDVHQIGPRKEAQRLHREKIMIRLGQGAFITKKLDSKAVRRALHAFARFKEIASRLHVNKIIAFGTSTLREVEDRDVFIERVRRTTGINVRVISGFEEARLIAIGILANYPVTKEKTALVDIGGGSTEISICQKKKVLFSGSFPLGVARLHQIFLERSPPAPERIKALREHIRKILLKKFEKENWPKVNDVLGSSGTIRTLAQMIQAKYGSDDMKFHHIQKLNTDMGKMTTNELSSLPGMDPKRVDMLLSGTVLFEECMNILRAKKAKATPYSLRDGILEEQKLLLLKKKEAVSRPAQIKVDLFQKARGFGTSEMHLRRAVKLAETLFRRLRPLHSLSEDWLLYLSAATIFRDIGEVVSPVKHEKHSYYIVKRTHLLPQLREWEIEFIAHLCLYHQRSHVELKEKELDFISGRKRKDAFLKLLAILQIVDALDTGADIEIGFKTVRTKRKSVELAVSGSRLTGLEILNVQKREEFFKQVFKKNLVAVPS